MRDAGPVHGLVESLFRRSAGRITALLAARLGPARLDVAEEAVQDALLKALQTWPHRGVPERQEAWLLEVARNRALDLLRGSARRDRAGDALLAELSLAAAREENGDELRLLLLCCHRSITARARVALALRTVGGFSVREIARAFLAEPDAVAQLLSRARRIIRDQGLELEPLESEGLDQRLDGALETLYLMFNEGHSATEGDRAVREELCIAAIRLTQMVLAEPVTARPEVHALLSLMLFQASRLGARIGPEGELRPLDEQDRSQWDRAMVASGFRHLTAAASGSRKTPWHVEAAIASVHARAASPEATEWELILRLYDDLLELKPTPVVRLNRAVALGRVRGPGPALEELDRLAGHPALRRYFLLDAVRADLLLRSGSHEAARAALLRALTRAGTEPERRLLRRKLEGVARDAGAA